MLNKSEAFNRSTASHMHILVHPFFPISETSKILNCLVHRSQHEVACLYNGVHVTIVFSAVSVPLRLCDNLFSQQRCPSGQSNPSLPGKI